MGRGSGERFTLVVKCDHSTFVSCTVRGEGGGRGKRIEWIF